MYILAGGARECYTKEKGGVTVEYRVIRSVEEIEPYLAQLRRARVMAVDTETTGLDPHEHRLRLIQLAAPGLPALVIDCDGFLPKGAGLLSRLFGTDRVKAFQNAKFDLKFLWPRGITVKPPVFDTMLAGALLRSSGGPRSVSLKTLAEYYLQEEVSKEERETDWGGKLREEQLAYAAKDAQITLRLREAMIPHLLRNRLKEIAKLEFDCVFAVAQMEYNGIFLDGEKWNALTELTEKQLQSTLEQIYTYTGRPVAQTTLWGEEISAGLNLDSPKQVQEILHAHGIETDATSKQALNEYQDHPLVRALLEYRRASKYLNSFLKPIPLMRNPVTHRLHAHYGQIGAPSGRMSCGGPNIQQIPRERAFRECFAAPKDRVLVIADYSQIELRVAAEMAGDERMIAAYRAGEDLHRLTASLVSGKPMEQISKQERQAAKAINFGLIYAMGAKGLQAYARQTYGVPMTLEQAELFRARFFQAYTGIRAWHERIRRNPPRETRTLGGRKNTYPEGKIGISGMYNTPVQGSAADIAKRALGLLSQRLEEDTLLIGMVHDEILLEAPKERGEYTARLLKQTMEQAGAEFLRRVPVAADVSVSADWSGK